MSLMPPTDLLEAATAARERAHAPYSQFRVGAAVRTEDGSCFAGCNVECSAYPLSVCAERNAVAAAVLAGAREVVEVVVVVDALRPASPCGGCRQVLAELAGDECRVFAVNLADPTQTWSSTLGELLPRRFRAGDLG